jgi:hypothetical protein
VGEGSEYLNLPPSVCELKAISSKFIFRFELKINGVELLNRIPTCLGCTARECAAHVRVREECSD